MCDDTQRACNWREIVEDELPYYRNILLAFEHHWNQVVGFYCGKGEYYETSANDNNSKITGPKPKWWMEIEEVPHARR